MGWAGKADTLKEASAGSFAVKIVVE